MDPCCMLLAAWLLAGLATAFPAATSKNTDVRLRESLNLLEVGENGDCIFMKSEEGMYSFASPGGPQICGLYVFSNPDQQVMFEFQEVDVSCAKGGLMSVIDGWELNGQFFPGPEDHPKPPSDRFSEFCGQKKHHKPFVTSQNVGLLMFRIPVQDEGFTVIVRFLYNPKPCNAMLQDPLSTYTLRNYGRRSNCSVTIMYPENIRVLASSVGTQSRFHASLDVETGIIKKCKKRGIADYVEIRGGDGMDPGQMALIDDFCGTDSIPSKSSLEVACGNTAVRLVSSGEFENSVTVDFHPLVKPTVPNAFCPSFFGLL